MSEDYVDLDPEVVSEAGRRTARTGADWSGWATQAESLLRQAASGARDSMVSSAFEGYVSQWNPTLQGLAGQVEALGSNAASAAGVMSGADADASAQLGSHGSSAQSLGSHLNRPLTG